MTWSKFDDKMVTNKKIVPLSDTAFRLYVSSIIWSSQHLEDGFVPTALAMTFSNTDKPHQPLGEALQELTTPLREGLNPLWTEVEGGYQIHDFGAYQPKAAEIRLRAAHVSAERSRAGSHPNHHRERGPRGQYVPKGTQQTRNAEPELNPNPSRPVPTSSSSAAAQTAPISLRTAFSGPISIAILDISQELKDEEHQASNTAHAMRLFEQSGLSEYDFVQLLYQVRAKLRNAQGTTNIKNKGAYFFELLRRELLRGGGPTREEATS
jgi:hypothetical protein